MVQILTVAFDCGSEMERPEASDQHSSKIEV